jgi:hypothetical protein
MQRLATTAAVAMTVSVIMEMLALDMMFSRC